MNVTTYGLDVGGRVFQVHWVEPETGEVKRQTLARTEVSAFFARREPGPMVGELAGVADLIRNEQRIEGPCARS